MSDEGEVELRVPSDERGGSEVFSASDSVGVLEDLEGKERKEGEVEEGKDACQSNRERDEGTRDVRGKVEMMKRYGSDLLGTLVKILSLKRSSRALLGLELVEENGVVLSVADVLREVVDSGTNDQSTKKPSQLSSLSREEDRLQSWEGRKERRTHRLGQLAALRWKLNHLNKI